MPDCNEHCSFLQIDMEMRHEDTKKRALDPQDGQRMGFATASLPCIGVSDIIRSLHRFIDLYTADCAMSRQAMERFVKRVQVRRVALCENLSYICENVSNCLFVKS